MYNEELEKLIDYALADGVITDKEKIVLFKKAKALGIDKDEFEMVLESILSEKLSIKESQEENKDEKIRKCPACNAFVDSFLAECPVCHTEFRNFGSSKTLKDLYDHLRKVPSEVKRLDFRYKTDSRDKDGATSHEEGFDTESMEYTIIRRQIEIIENFPIPYTKQDVLEFLQFAIPKMKSSQIEKNLRLAWSRRFEEVFERAKIVFRNDEILLKELESIKIRLDKFKVARRRKTMKVLYTIFSVFLICAVILGLVFRTPILKFYYSESDEILYLRIYDAIEKNNFTKAKRLSSYFEYYSDQEQAYVRILEKEILTLIEGGNVPKAEILFFFAWDSFLKNNSAIENFTRPIIISYINNDEQIKAQIFINTLQRLGDYSLEVNVLNKMYSKKWPSN